MVRHLIRLAGPAKIGRDWHREGDEVEVSQDVRQALALAGLVAATGNPGDGSMSGAGACHDAIIAAKDAEIAALKERLAVLGEAGQQVAGEGQQGSPATGGAAAAGSSGDEAPARASAKAGRPAQPKAGSRSRAAKG